MAWQGRGRGARAGVLERLQGSGAARLPRSDGDAPPSQAVADDSAAPLASGPTSTTSSVALGALNGFWVLGRPGSLAAQAAGGTTAPPLALPRGAPSPETSLVARLALLSAAPGASAALSDSGLSGLVSPPAGAPLSPLAPGRWASGSIGDTTSPSASADPGGLTSTACVPAPDGRDSPLASPSRSPRSPGRWASGPAPVFYAPALDAAEAVVEPLSPSRPASIDRVPSIADVALVMTPREHLLCALAASDCPLLPLGTLYSPDELASLAAAGASVWRRFGTCMSAVGQGLVTYVDDVAPHGSSSVALSAHQAADWYIDEVGAISASVGPVQSVDLAAPSASSSSSEGSDSARDSSAGSSAPSFSGSSDGSVGSVYRWRYDCGGIGDEAEFVPRFDDFLTRTSSLSGSRPVLHLVAPDLQAAALFVVPEELDPDLLRAVARALAPPNGYLELRRSLDAALFPALPLADLAFEARRLWGPVQASVPVPAALPPPRVSDAAPAAAAGPWTAWSPDAGAGPASPRPGGPSASVSSASSATALEPPGRVAAGPRPLCEECGHVIERPVTTCWGCGQAPALHHEDCCPRGGLPVLPLPRVVTRPPAPPAPEPPLQVQYRHPMEPVLLALAGQPCTLVADRVRWERREADERPGVWFALAIPAVVLDSGRRVALPPDAHVTLAVLPASWPDARVELAVDAVVRWLLTWRHLPRSRLRTTLVWPLDRTFDMVVRTGCTPLLCLRVDSAAHAACHLLADSALAAARAMRPGSGIYPAFHVRFALR